MHLKDEVLCPKESWSYFLLDLASNPPGVLLKRHPQAVVEFLYSVWWEELSCSSTRHLGVPELQIQWSRIEFPISSSPLVSGTGATAYPLTSSTKTRILFFFPMNAMSTYNTSLGSRPFGQKATGLEGGESNLRKILLSILCAFLSCWSQLLQFELPTLWEYSSFCFKIPQIVEELVQFFLSYCKKWLWRWWLNNRNPYVGSAV